jgi:hypothetical protein
MQEIRYWTLSGNLVASTLEIGYPPHVGEIYKVDDPTSSPVISQTGTFKRILYQ